MPDQGFCQSRAVRWSSGDRNARGNVTRESPLESDVDATGVDDLVRLGQRIAEVRKQRGWTQTDLAEAADISRVTVSKIERGATDVGYVRLVRLARALGLPASALVD